MGKAKSTFKEKVAWMVKNHLLWKNWPSAPVSDDMIIARMQDDGLVSKKSNTWDILDFGKLVIAAREDMKKRKTGDFL